MRASKSTGSKRAATRRDRPRPRPRSASEVEHEPQLGRAEPASSVLRRSTVSVADWAMTFTRFGNSDREPTVPTWSPPMSCGEVAHGSRNARRDVSGVPAHAHRRGARMVRLAADRDLLPGDALDALDGTDGDALGFEHRTLFDVQFDERVRHETWARMRPGIANPVQFVAEPRTVDTVVSSAARARAHRRTRGCRACRARSANPPRR